MQNTQRPPARTRLAYYLPRRVFWHYCLWQEMRRLGFRVLCVIKLNHHHVWDVRLRASAKLNDKGARKLRRELRKLCAAHGTVLKAGELVVARSGRIVELALIWPVGEPGYLNWRDLQSAAAGAGGQEPWDWN